MPNAQKNSGVASAAAKEMPFEEALKKLESIVESMESGDQPLETMLARFEEGVGLVKTCQGRLEEAELKISKLEKNSTGETVLKPAAEFLSENE